jgi:hypothetical protein
MTESENVPKIVATPLDRHTTTVLSFAVTGAAPVPAQYSGKPFRPEIIVIKIQDGNWTKVEITGPRVLKDNRPGKDWAHKAWFMQRDLDTDAPAWVKDALDYVRQTEGVTR